jgi:hypothetical protein
VPIDNKDFAPRICFDTLLPEARNPDGFAPA